MKRINEFAKSVGVIGFSPGDNIVLEVKGRYFLLEPRLSQYVRKRFSYAGTCMGRVKAGKFFPSFDLLQILADLGGRSAIVDKKAAWLFVCGRDVFAKSVIALRGLAKRNEAVLVLNEYRECLGLGKTILDLGSQTRPNEVVVKNIVDIGDFLRRER